MAIQLVSQGYHELHIKLTNYDLPLVFVLTRFHCLWIKYDIILVGEELNLPLHQLTDACWTTIQISPIMIPSKIA